jgi:hypothetical protein
MIITNKLQGYFQDLFELNVPKRPAFESWVSEERTLSLARAGATKDGMLVP